MEGYCDSLSQLALSIPWTTVNSSGGKESSSRTTDWAGLEGGGEGGESSLSSWGRGGRGSFRKIIKGGKSGMLTTLGGNVQLCVL